MPRYFFHIRNHVQVDDTEGMELRNAGDARLFAIHAARDIASLDVKEEGVLNLSHRIDVADEAGAPPA